MSFLAVVALFILNDAQGPEIGSTSLPSLLALGYFLVGASIVTAIPAALFGAMLTAAVFRRDYAKFLDVRER